MPPIAGRVILCYRSRDADCVQFVDDRWARVVESFVLTVVWGAAASVVFALMMAAVLWGLLVSTAAG